MTQPASAASGAPHTVVARLGTYFRKRTLPFYHPYKYAELMPNLIFGEADALELGQIEPALKDAVESAIARFVTGNLSIDDDWDGYVRELEGLGRDRCLDVYQQALDAKRTATGACGSLWRPAMSTLAPTQ